MLLPAGIELVTRVMDVWHDHEGVQCNSCMALMALVRGTGSVCQVRPRPAFPSPPPPLFPPQPFSLSPVMLQ